MAYSFTDKLGNAWIIDLTVASVERVLRDTNVDMREGQVEAIADIFKCTDVLWCLVGDQHAEISAEKFRAILGGQQFGEARSSLLAAWMSFTQSLNVVTPALQEIVDEAEQATREVETQLRATKRRGKKKGSRQESSPTT